MAQNDPHVALIIIYDYTYVGGGGFGEKNFRAKICVSAPSAPTSIVTQNKGPSTEAHSFNPPFGGRLPPPPPCVTFRLVAASLRGPGQSPARPFACCVGSLRSVGRCGRCSCWCRFRVRGAPPPPPPKSNVQVAQEFNSNQHFFVPQLFCIADLRKGAGGGDGGVA